MKTIAQIATEIGVSKQAVQKRIAREPLCTRLYPCIHLEKNVKYIDKTGENIIKLAFNKNQPTTASIDVADNPPSHVHNDILKILQENITVLQKQLEIKDKQIEELTTTVRTQAESINADRKNELAGTIIDGQKKLMGVSQPEQTSEESQPKKKGFFSFFKK